MFCLMCTDISLLHIMHGLLQKEVLKILHCFFFLKYNQANPNVWLLLVLLTVDLFFYGSICVDT